MDYPHPASFHAIMARRFSEYAAGTRAAYCVECQYTGTFKFVRGVWRHMPTKRDRTCTYTIEGN